MSALALGLGILGAGLGGRVAYQMFRASRGGTEQFLRGGFKAKMDKSEALQVLGLREPITSVRLKDAHRKLMLANHPDRGGSPYLAGKVNEARVLLDIGGHTDMPVETDDEDDPFLSLPPPSTIPVQSMLTNYQTINVLAPLVRCSKLPFRHLCSLYETHVTHTPMVLAEEFSRSQAARISDFTTSRDERGVFWMEPRGSSSSGYSNGHSEDREGVTFHKPGSTSRLPPTPEPPTKHSELVRGALIAQFASPNATSLADAAELIAPYVDGVDLNCGCPQRWAYNEGIGCALLRKPELVREMVRAVKGRLGWDWPVSIKIRVDPDLKLTDRLVKTALQANVSHITIHGRTRHQASTEPVSLPGIRFAVEAARGEVPCVGNGDLWDLEDAARMRDETGVRGVMGARGLLANPALFAGYETTPKHAVQQFVDLSIDYGFIFPLFQRHLSYMLESHFSKPEQTYFNSLPSSVSAINYLSTRGLDFSAARSTPMWDARRGRTLF